MASSEDCQIPRCPHCHQQMTAVMGHATLDIRFRMLEPKELARAMGFSDAETAYEFAGNKTEITKQIGNAVPVNLAAALVGAAFLVLADLLARALLPPTEIPVGILTAFIGGPFFLWLLRRERREYRL